MAEGSPSSNYMTDEDEEVVEVTERKSQGAIRKRREDRRSDSDDEGDRPMKKNRNEMQKKGGNSREELEMETEDEVKELDWFEGKVEKFKRAMDRIYKAVSRESGGKIQMTRGDQQDVKEIVHGLQGEFMDVMMGQRRMEVEIGLLKMKISNLERKSVAQVRRRGVVDGSDSSVGSVDMGRPMVRRRTYAQVSGNSSNKSMHGERKSEGKIQGRVVVGGDKGWKTPPLRRGGKSEEAALVVTSRGEKDGKKLIQQIVEKMPAAQIGGPPQMIRVAREGRVIVVAKDEGQRKKIEEGLKRIEGVEARQGKRALPLIMISGLMKGIEEKELIGQIKRGGEISEEGEVTIVRRMTCRNPYKENVIFRTGVENFKRIVKKGKIEIGCEIFFAEEYLGVAMCYKCCRFGHITKHCSEKEACHRCGGSHDGRECQKTTSKCINCWRMYGKECGHSARDSGCPAFQEMLERSRKNLNYSG